MNEEVQPVVKKKGHSVLIVIMLIIILLLIGIIVFLLLNGNSKKNENTNNNDKEIKQEELNDNGIKNIMARFKGIKISSDRLYQNDKFDINNINTNELLVTALSKLNVYNVCAQEGLKRFSIDEINEEINKYVKKTIILEDLNKVDYAAMGNPYDYSYNISIWNNETLEVTDSVCGSEFGAEDYINSKVIKAVREGDYIYVYEKEAFARYAGNFEEEIYKVNYYKDYRKTGTPVETKASSEFSYKNADTTPTWDLYNTYKYTFKLVDGTFYFQSFELDK